MGGQPAFVFAGLMSRHKSKGDSEETILTAAIVTKAAEDTAVEVHDRIPVILPKVMESAWLDREQQDEKVALEMAQSVAVKDVDFYAVSSRVNSSKSVGAELIEPYANPA